MTPTSENADFVLAGKQTASSQGNSLLGWTYCLTGPRLTNILTQVPAFHPGGSNASLPPWKWMQWLLKCRHVLFSFPNCVKGHQFSVLSFEWHLDQSLQVDASQPVWDYEGHATHTSPPRVLRITAREQLFLNLSWKYPFLIFHYLFIPLVDRSSVASRSPM